MVRVNGDLASGVSSRAPARLLVEAVLAPAAIVGDDWAAGGWEPDVRGARLAGREARDRAEEPAESRVVCAEICCSAGVNCTVGGMGVASAAAGTDAEAAVESLPAGCTDERFVAFVGLAGFDGVVGAEDRRARADFDLCGFSFCSWPGRGCSTLCVLAPPCAFSLEPDIATGGAAANPPAHSSATSPARA